MAVQIVRPNVEEETKNKLGALDLISQGIGIGTSIQGMLPGQKGPVGEGIDMAKDAGSGKPVSMNDNPLTRRFYKMGGRFNV